MQALITIGRPILGTVGILFGYEMFLKGFKDHYHRTSSKIAEQMAIQQKTLKDIADKKNQAKTPEEIQEIDNSYNEFKNKMAKIHVGFNKEVSMQEAATYKEKCDKNQVTLKKISLFHQANNFFHKNDL